MPGAEPVRHDGGPVGVLLCHGFTGTPASLAEWAAYLAEAGHAVSVPRLPGHGTTWQEMNRTRWQDWYAAVERELLELADRHDSVVVGGLSMGGGLALRLAQQHPDLVRGLMLVNPSVKLPLHALHSSLQLNALVLRALPEVSAPLLVMRSTVDHVVPVSSGQLVLDRVSSTDVTDVRLHDSFHVATQDDDAPLIFARSAEFIERVCVPVSR
jgi:carboxylesterase